MKFNDKVSVSLWSIIHSYSIMTAIYYGIITLAFPSPCGV